MSHNYRDLPIYEADSFTAAKIDLLEHSLNLLEKRDVKVEILQDGRGSARLLNLLQWDLQAATETIDGDGPIADQVIHAAMHHFSDACFGSDTAQTMLFGECLASAIDFYLLGKILAARIETDFVIDTIDSLASYYEQYGDPEQLQTILETASAEPYPTFIQIASYLYQAVAPLLNARDPHTISQHLLKAQDHPYWPLLHHYNIGNWVLTLRARFQNPQDTPFDHRAAIGDLGNTEVEFLEVFVNHC